VYRRNENLPLFLVLPAFLDRRVVQRCVQATAEANGERAARRMAAGCAGACAAPLACGSCDRAGPAVSRLSFIIDLACGSCDRARPAYRRRYGPRGWGGTRALQALPRLSGGGAPAVAPLATMRTGGSTPPWVGGGPPLRTSYSPRRGSARGTAGRLRQFAAPVLPDVAERWPNS
jgi:hypothetical protein